jgi:hypothetical protein
MFFGKRLRHAAPGRKQMDMKRFIEYLIISTIPARGCQQLNIQKASHTAMFGQIG